MATDSRRGPEVATPPAMLQENDLTSLTKNFDSELKTLRDELGKVPANPDQDMEPVLSAVEYAKKNFDALAKLCAAALAQLPNTFCVDGVDVPEYRAPLAGSDLPAVPPTIDPVIVPTNPPIGPPLQEAQKDPSTPQEDAPGAPKLPATS